MATSLKSLFGDSSDISRYEGYQVLYHKSQIINQEVEVVNNSRVVQR